MHTSAGSFLCPLGTVTKQECVGKTCKVQCRPHTFDATNEQMIAAEALFTIEEGFSRLTVKTGLRNAEVIPVAMAQLRAAAATLQTSTATLQLGSDQITNPLNSMNTMMAWGEASGIKPFKGAQKLVKGFRMAIALHHPKITAALSKLDAAEQAANDIGTERPGPIYAARRDARAALANVLKSAADAVEAEHENLMSGQFFDHSVGYDLRSLEDIAKEVLGCNYIGRICIGPEYII